MINVSRTQLLDPNLLMLGMLCFLVGNLNSCTTSWGSGSLSKSSDATDDFCNIAADDYPRIAILNSTDLGGKYSGPMRVPYTGDVPPQWVLYQSRHVIFTKNISKRPDQPFFAFQCAKLNQNEVDAFVDKVETIMPETFEKAQTREQMKGVSEIIYHRNIHECGQFELIGSIDGAFELNQLARSSVAERVPLPLIEVLQEAQSFQPSVAAQAWFPREVLLDFQPAKLEVKDSKPWPEKTFALKAVSDKERRLLRNDRHNYFIAPIHPKQLKHFSELVRSPVRMRGKDYHVAFRFLLPHDQLWAAPYPSKGQETSVCNRYISRTNYWSLYGLQKSIAGKAPLANRSTTIGDLEE